MGFTTRDSGLQHTKTRPGREVHIQGRREVVRIGSRLRLVVLRQWVLVKEKLFLYRDEVKVT